ncbi:hypothetical protein GCM10022252_67720 [Streptosporangium oxazolinicum]|uniref:Uncharacterized protein n=1 Tax=Streptosporangium oxazolinicum TaxID=909287 RepID=A0ABP8BG75_9ACTN
MLRDLMARHGRTWIIAEGAGGCYAVRRVSLRAHGLERGLCNVRCGATVEELARNLDEETRLEKRSRLHQAF